MKSNRNFKERRVLCS